MLERIVNNTDADSDYTIRKYLANGWYIFYEGITITVMRKDDKYEFLQKN